VYGLEVVLPSDLHYGSPRVQAYRPVKEDKEQQDASNLLKESRDIAVTRYQQMLCQYHARRVHPWAFQVGDLVLRRIQIKKGKHKLTLSCEGPYLVAEVIQPGAYQL
jgi:hypothetical protein